MQSVRKAWRIVATSRGKVEWNHFCYDYHTMADSTFVKMWGGSFFTYIDSVLPSCVLYIGTCANTTWGPNGGRRGLC